jgi:hypothetical protein
MDKFIFQTHAAARPLSDIDDIIINAFNKIWPFFGIALFAMFVYGGVMWMMSSGDPQKLNKAQGTLLWAFIGILILALMMWIFGVFEAVLGIAPGTIGNWSI